ncbi:MAG: glycosyl hydrolase, partial [Candidatus Kapabacteria bacterium]|nr:glycosyl hydrolase [Candidatus Kapabacteria bacterium]
MKNVFLFIISLTFITSIAISKEKVTEKKENKNEITESTVSGLKLRSIGPAIASGRIVDIAVNPNNFDEFYLAVACGGVWKTTNHGTSFQPIFENEASFSTGCVTIDPNNPFVVWVGSGENNSQRSVSYGDGVYKSTDAGKSWKNMGLKKSEHIGKIVVDPRNSNVVFVAAQGPLWNPGGDRGLYKSTDGGETWTESLKVSENTGVSDLVFDNRNPDVMYCSSYQRRRHVWTLIDGGPEGAVYKTTDAGKTWNKLSGGLPSGDIGRIGLGISPVNPDILFAQIELPDGGGFYKSTDRGGSWSKTNSGLGGGAAQYYQELFCDPKNADIVYSVNTYTSVTRDGGKTFSSLSTKEKHVDDHVIWINPKNTLNLIMGCDGGLYESNDGGNSWRYFENLSITQFYRVSVDNALPFYNVFGGTQDNNSLGGPSRTKSANGIMNQDWIYTVGGDGYKTVVDPKDPNVIYAQSQYGGLVRYDKKSGEMNYIQPQPEKGEELRWNWDTPILISPHKNTRLYFAANKLFVSDDRGQSWKKISPDLTQQINRDKLPVMGRVWE